MSILIAGAGIGGLTTALSLHAAGVRPGEIRLLEAVPDIRPLGVGLNILPNAVRELAELGLLDELSAVSVPTGSLGYHNRYGRLIWHEPRGLQAGYRWPQLSVHRGRLQSVLAGAVRERLGADAIVTDSRVEGFTPLSDGRVRVGVRHPAAGGTSQTEADVLIGADGIRSAVRAALHPDEGPPRWNGLIVWRGTTWAPPFLDGSTMVIAGDDRRRAVVYPMSGPGADPARPAGAPPGSVLMNWAVARAADPGSESEPADWNRAVRPADFLDAFTDLAFDWLDIPALIRTADEAYVYPMVDRDPLPRWTHGPVTLLGDAAHAMYPMGSNGATQSIVDARVLARALALYEDPHAALTAYEAERLPALTRIQQAARRRGPEVVIDLAHERAPGGFDRVQDVFPGTELADISADFARLGGFDPDHVNHRPSHSVVPAAGAAL
ncbi:flavin-dependent oxidoreductase [Streptomyces venezuelae]|uniref:Flavin-dependent oxidoreductase n=1 Tax=Streptomyces venezuelae TaxID=54571 RepID=A0A5P2CZW8_STRVZ|nr:flavin-dependent oxidoreductase [Streptomyces venezuelae]QES47507.1 flavin-dependent oxidoreductase [Streptomyces venezuelae]